CSFQAEDGIRDFHVTGVQTCALPIFDEKGLTQIAEITGGRFFRATDSDSLQEIYDTIDELEPSPAEVRQLVSHEERFRPWLLSGDRKSVVEGKRVGTSARRWRRQEIP